MDPHELPEFVAPMLAKSGPPFDSPDHLFEVKWDGMRTLAYAEHGRVRLVNRHRHDVTDRFPEMAALDGLESGAILDGELVVTVDGKPDFAEVMRRRHARSEATVRTLVQAAPATFVAFDLVYRRFHPLCDRPLAERRAQLLEVTAAHPSPRLVLSDGVTEHGLALYEHACEQGLEGIVAKRLDSRYLPGQRSDAWRKSKREQTALCVILGFLPEGHDDIKSLAVAEQVDGALRYVGQVGSGLSTRQRRELRAALDARPRAQPLVPCPGVAARWVEPQRYCKVTYLERTHHGNLRAPRIAELLSDGDAP